MEIGKHSEGLKSGKKKKLDGKEESKTRGDATKEGIKCSAAKEKAEGKKSKNVRGKPRRKEKERKVRSEV